MEEAPGAQVFSSHAEPASCRCLRTLLAQIVDANYVEKRDFISYCSLVAALCCGCQRVNAGETRRTPLSCHQSWHGCGT